MLGGAWTKLPLKAIPSTVSILLICIVELGSITEDTLIRCDIDVTNPKGRIAASDVFDASVTGNANLIARYVAMRRLSFEATEAGVWTFKVSSGGIPLADYDIEIGLDR